jgi:hypothetical protein
MLAAVACLALAMPSYAGAADAARDDEAFVRTWRTLRAVDCARCHGGDHHGLAAPSIVDYARLVGHDRFVAAILDGNGRRVIKPMRVSLRLDCSRRGLGGSATPGGSRTAEATILESENRPFDVAPRQMRDADRHCEANQKPQHSDKR